MSIIGNFKSNRSMKVHVQELEKKITKLQQDQELLVKDILTYEETMAKYKGNDYPKYEIAVEAISNKYKNISDWGCVMTGAIIDLRAAFILGEGVKISHASDIDKGQAVQELKFVNDFFEYNDLDAEMSQEIAKEAEIEGKIALRLVYEKEPFKEWDGMISARFIPWTSKKYRVFTDPNDYLWYKELKWTPQGQQKEEILTEESFVYKKFGGRINDPNDAQPKIMKCLTLVDRLDHALKDLREINHLFASPTPIVKCVDDREVAAVSKLVKDINWKIGKLFVTTGVFSFQTIDSSANQNLIAEIETLIKMISGTTGIPIHFLGLLDLLRNRATGDNTRELVNAATSREREIWRGAYEETITKAMNMFNATANAQKSVKLDPTKISVEIPQVTQEQWDRIEKVLIPASTAGIVTKEFVASQIPGVDQDEEAKRKAKNDESDFKKMEAEMKLAEENAKNNPIVSNTNLPQPKGETIS